MESVLKPIRPKRDKIRSIFVKSQEQFRHQVLVEKCKALYRESEDDNFLEEFKTALRYSLAHPDKEGVDNILSFVARFVILLYTVGSKDDLDGSDTINEECTFPNAILELLFKTHGASLTQVRLRCLQLMNKILSGMPENSTISDGIWVKLKETVLTRIQDKSPAVRVQAVLTARKLQDPRNAKCEIIKAFIFHLNDPSSVVRRTVVSSIAFNKLTIGHVLARTRDVNDNVRRNTFIVFSKVRVLNLTIKYRLTILERGLQDRSALVRNCAQSILLVNWLENFNKDVVKFLEALDVINCASEVFTIVENIFKVQPMEETLKSLPLDEETRLVPAEKLTPEIALLWRAVAQKFWNDKNEDELEKVLPNITTFCDYIRKLADCLSPLDKPCSLNLSHDEKWEEVKEKEVLKHLLELIKVFDLADELGRSNLKKLLFDMLSSQRLDNDKIECLIELVASVIPSQECFLQELTEVISEVREPLVVETTSLTKHQQLQIEIEISNRKVELNDLREREYNAVSKKDYAQAESIKSEIERIEAELKDLNVNACVSQEVREEKNDPVTVCKCLTILMHMIKYSKVRTLTPTLRNIKDNFLKQCLTSQDLQTQSLSVQVLGQFCVLDLDMATENLFRFLIMLSENGEDEINGPALKAIFDILLYHGVKPFENLHGEGNETKTQSEEDDLFLCEVEKVDQAPKFIPILVELLNCKSNDVLKSIAFEGLCKLLLSGAIYSSAILENIVIKGFSPIIDNETEDYIRQVFMVFFPVFASSTPRSQEMIESAFIPILGRLSTATVGSPEADIDPRDVASFLIEYTRPNINKKTSMTLHVHNNLAMCFCHEILKEADNDADAEIYNLYLKSLLQLKLSLDDECFAHQIRVLTDKIRKVVNDRILIRHLNEFKKRIENVHNTLTSIENTLMTTRETTEIAADVSRRKIRNGKVSQDDSDDSSDSSSFLETPKKRNDCFVPESPEMSE